MIDGEGHVEFRRKFRGKYEQWNRAVKISNTDWDIICATAEACRVFSVPFTVRYLPNDKPSLSRPNRQPQWALEIHRHEGFSRLLDVVTLKASRKQEALQALVESYSRVMTPPSKEELEEFYVAQGCSIQDIAERYSCSQQTARRWLIRYGIERRSAYRDGWQNRRREQMSAV